MIKKILEFQNKVTPSNDKLAHFFWGFWIALFGVALSLIFNWVYWICIPSFVLATVKEYWDSKGNGSVEFLDFLDRKSVV